MLEETPELCILHNDGTVPTNGWNVVDLYAHSYG